MNYKGMTKEQLIDILKCQDNIIMSQEEELKHLHDYLKGLHNCPEVVKAILTYKLGCDVIEYKVPEDLKKSEDEFDRFLNIMKYGMSNTKNKGTKWEDV